MLLQLDGFIQVRILFSRFTQRATARGIARLRGNTGCSTQAEAVFAMGVSYETLSKIAFGGE